jgi:DNA invertase Pin-like site-specific DNA recombinase
MNWTPPSTALVLYQQAIDTTTPAGRMFFQVTGAFAEFERGDDPQPRHGRTGARQGTRCASWAAEDWGES